MERAIMFLVFVFLAVMVSAQNISNVDFHQAGDEIVITNDLGESSPIWVYVSLDGGKSYKEMRSVRGDVGRTVLPGKKRIVWKVLGDIPEGLNAQVCFRLSPNLIVFLNDVELEMVYVKGDTFRMGATEEQRDNAYTDEKAVKGVFGNVLKAYCEDVDARINAVHQVILSDYFIGKFEVTQGQWEKVMGNNPSYFKKGDNYPVDRVSWEDAQAFCRELSRRTGKKYALPTEAQWENAARGGNRNEGSKYSGSDAVDVVAWYVDNSGYSTHPVGTKCPNALGLYDMSGKVWEWCQDWYAYYKNSSEIDPAGPETGSSCVLRGGDWRNDARCCRVSDRVSYYPGIRGSNGGFRVVLLLQ